MIRMKTRMQGQWAGVVMAFLLLMVPRMGWGQPAGPKTEVWFIATIHGAHKVNPNYPYDSLFSFVDRLDPDVVGVEIRSEDIDSSLDYLKNNYPYEMYESIGRYSGKIVRGFDWLGADLEGRGIPTNYWQEVSTVKKLQGEMGQDSAMQAALSVLKPLNGERNKLALNATLHELNVGKYDVLNFVYYEQLKLIFKDTPYIALSEFYQKRDEHIAQNIINIIKAHPGKRLVFLLGADHRDYTVKAIQSQMGKDIIMLQGG